MLLAINSDNPQTRLIRKTVDILRDGGIIVYPTDTVYGLGCDLFNKRGIEKIYEIKRRSMKQPFSFICADLKDISNYAIVSNYAYKTMRRMLPGPYTFILEATRLVPKILLTKRKTVGIRVPDNEICLSIVRELGHPIISTSVTTGDEILSDPAEIEKKYGRAVDLVIDGGILATEKSSVVSLVNDIPEVIRVGKGDVSLFQ
ncbi:MAG: threonylcarbamoyl-AMP synthase [Syntrophobacterales bacterium]|nr:threonylcarbamoyl-AMP synthase [Syntrophobacterales bacterium]